MKNKKIFMVLFVVFLCAAGVFTHNANASAKTYQTGTNVKKDLEQQKKKLKKLQGQYKKAAAKMKQAEAAYKKQQKGVKTIFMGTVISTNPFIVHSSYILSPCKGYYLISNAKSLWGTYSGEIKLTGGTYQYGSIVCQKAKDVSSSKEVKKYNAAKKKADTIHTSVQVCKDRISRMKKLLKDSVTLYDIEMTNGKTVKYEDWFYKFSVSDDYYSNDFSKIKWESSDSSIVSVTNNITKKFGKPVLKAKKEGTVTLSATYMTSKKTTKCKVKVISKIDRIEVSAECLEMPEDKKITISDYISVKCYPETASQEVNYIVDKEGIGGIVIDNEKGTLKASYQGVYTVYVEPVSGEDVQASFQVSVYDNGMLGINSDYSDIRTYSGTVPVKGFEECMNEIADNYQGVVNVAFGNYTAYDCGIVGRTYNLDNGAQLQSQIAVDDRVGDIFFIQKYKDSYTDSSGNVQDYKQTIQIMTSKLYCMQALQGYVRITMEIDGDKAAWEASAPLMDMNKQCVLQWEEDSYQSDEVSQELQNLLNLSLCDAFDGWEELLYSTVGIHMSDMGFGRAY